MQLTRTNGEKARKTTTVGLAQSDFNYSPSMTPTHYSDAINQALANTTSGEVFLRGENVGFTSATNKVVTPVNGVAIRGSGIDKTVITTARTDYVFKNTVNALSNSAICDMTIDCQNITNVSGAEIRKFNNYRVEKVKFKNSTKWFFKSGNEPAASTTDMNDGLVIQDTVFDTHDGIYEMLLINNTYNVVIERSQFKNKTGSAGAAPVIGLWQKVEGVKIVDSSFSELISSAIYYGYTTNNILITGCDFSNVGQALRGGIVSDFGKFGVKSINNLRFDHFNIFGGANSTASDAIQIGSVDGFTIDTGYISNHAKGIKIGFGNNVPTASDGGDAHYPSKNGYINDVTFKDINVADNNKNLNSPIYFGNGGDFEHLLITDIKVRDPSNHLDYAVIFNGAVTGTVSVSGGAVTGITIVNNYAWYSTAPAVTFTGDGTNAAATAIIDSDGHLTGFTITNGGTGYTSATVAIAGANYKNIIFRDCDFGGKKIRLNDSVQIDTTSVKFVNCTNFDTSNLSAAFINACVINTNSIIMRDGLLGVATTTLDANATFQLGDGSAVTTFRHNNIRQTNSNDNLQTIFANFTGKTWTWYKNNTNTGSRRIVFDIDTGVMQGNGFNANLGTDLTTAGIVVKQLTTTQRNALTGVVNGSIIYNTTDNKFQGYENTSWVNLI